MGSLFVRNSGTWVEVAPGTGLTGPTGPTGASGASGPAGPSAGFSRLFLNGGS